MSAIFSPDETATMSLETYTVHCDWPDCLRSLHIEVGSDLETIAFTQSWRFEDDIHHGLHLCPAHRQRSWQELHQAIADAEE